MRKIIPYNGTEKYIFISYAHRDAEQVFKIVEQLAAAGCRIWYDEGIEPGTEWDENIAEHIKKCDGMLAFISQNYIDSKNCRDELNFARDEEKDHLLVYLEDVKLRAGMAMRMNRQQAVFSHTYSREGDFYEKLMKAPMILRCQGKPAGSADAESPAEDGDPDDSSEGIREDEERLYKEIKGLCCLLELDPEDDTYQYALAKRYRDLTYVYDKMNQKEKMAEAYREAVRILRHLTEAHYKEEYLSELADICEEFVDYCGDILSRKEETELQWERVRALSAVIDDDPVRAIDGAIWDFIDNVIALSIPFEYGGRAYLEESDPQEAEKIYRKITGLSRCLVEVGLKSEDVIYMGVDETDTLVSIHDYFADFLNKRDQSEEAETMYREALRISQICFEHGHDRGDRFDEYIEIRDRARKELRNFLLKTGRTEET